VKLHPIHLTNRATYSVSRSGAGGSSNDEGTVVEVHTRDSLVSGMGDLGGGSGNDRPAHVCSHAGACAAATDALRWAVRMAKRKRQDKVRSLCQSCGARPRACKNECPVHVQLAGASGGGWCSSGAGHAYRPSAMGPQRRPAWRGNTPAGSACS